MYRYVPGTSTRTGIDTRVPVPQHTTAGNNPPFYEFS